MKTLQILIYRMVFTSGSTQLLFLLANLLLPFLYSTSAIGSYGFFISLASVFAIISSLRLDYFAFFANKSEGLRPESALLCGLIILSAVLILIGLALGLSLLTTKQGLSLALSLVSFSCFYLSTQLILLKKKYRLYAHARLMQGLILIVLLFLFRGSDYLGLVSANAFSQFFIAAYLLRGGKFRISWAEIPLLFVYRARDRATNVCTTLMQYLSPALPMILGFYLFPKNELGIYFLMSQLLGGAGSILRRSLLAIFNAELIKEGRADPKALALINRMFLGSIVLALFVFMLVLSIPRDWLLEGEWYLFRELLPPLLVLYILDAFLQPIGSLLPAIGLNLGFFAIEFIRLIGLLISFYLSWLLNFSILHFVYLYSTVMGSCYLLAGFVFTYRSYCEE